MKYTDADVQAKLDECSKWLDLEQWRLFDNDREERATKRKPWTMAARMNALSKLGRLHEAGYDTAKIMDRSIEAGWLGLFEKDEYKRPREPRDTTVTDLTLVVRSDEETGRANIDALKLKARRGCRSTT